MRQISRQSEPNAIPPRPRHALPLIWKSTVYFTLAIAVVFIGLASRRYRDHLPGFIAEYAGDTLWALMVFLLISTVFSGGPIGKRSIIALILSFLVETSQLYHAPWIDAIRQTTLGGLVLGHGFLWTDLICYSVGIASGSIAEWRLKTMTHRIA